MGVEGSVHEAAELLLRLDVTRGDGRQEVHPQGGSAAQLGGNGFRSRQDVVLQHIVHVLLVPGQEDGLPVLVILRPTSSPAHLLDFQDGDVVVPVVGVVAAGVADDDTACGKVDSTCQSRGGGDHLQLAVPEQILHHPTLLVRQACVVEGRPTSDVLPQSAPNGGGLFLPPYRSVGGLRQD